MIQQIGPALEGLDADDQRLVDQTMIDLDGTPNKAASRRQRDPRRLARGRQGRGRLGRPARSTATSAAPTRTCCPVPMMNILNGGAHADTNVDIQEFMIAPIGAADVPRGAAARAPRSTTRSRPC